MRSSHVARGALGHVGLLVVLGMGCSSSHGAARLEDGAERAGAPAISAPHDAGQEPRPETARDGAMQHPSTAPGRTGEPDSASPPLDSGSGPGNAGQSSQAGSAAGGEALPMAGSGGAPACEADCSPAEILRPELLDIWYFGWQGGNPSFFQIGLCGDGVATYVFADSPNDPNALRLTGRYDANGPDRLVAHFMGAQPHSREPLRFELVYDAAHDRLHRTPNADGYSDYGARLSHFTWAQPAATCPTP
jgi:hypothetical protein